MTFTFEERMKAIEEGLVGLSNKISEIPTLDEEDNIVDDIFQILQDQRNLLSQMESIIQNIKQTIEAATGQKS